MSVDSSAETTSNPKVNAPTTQEREIELAIGEKVKLKSLVIGEMELFHGTTETGISQFNDAEETTVGSGVYLTSKREDAIGYSFVRATRRHKEDSPIVYDVKIENMNLLTLNTRDTISDFMKYFRQELYKWRKEELPKKELPEEKSKIYESNLIRVNKDLWEAIQSGTTLRPTDFLKSCGDATREILSKEGYDGIMTIEGGESGTNPLTGEYFEIGDHDSYVVFDPKKVNIVREENQSEAI